ncbi:MAG: NAD-dependent DNA ligase LigA [Lachnospiraceae bacterium]|nr:NAD-dependent DNA ligase LigA [Lachnospiraceae bacterium]
MIEEKDIITEYSDLCDRIRYHMDRYYNDDAPEIEDAEYDAMMRRLKEIEHDHPEMVRPDSPSQIIGGKTKREAGINVEHDVPMLSIEDVFSMEDVLSWVHEVREMHPDAHFSVEHKIDGLSMSIRYEKGRLTLAETRGDGHIGEDVTANALVVGDVVPVLKGIDSDIELRGEVYMSHEDFDRVNERMELAGKKPFANPRNCAAGTLRQLDSSVVKERGLSMFVFNVQRAEDASFMASHTEALRRLKGAGVHVVPSFLCVTDEEIVKAIDEIGDRRGEYPYDIDGAVVKIDEISYRADFPAGSKYSAGHIAYKYPPEEKESVIREIELSVGMTGRINPTAVFDPIRLCGTSVSRATLHNQDFISALGIGIGRTVVVYKSGEIIPKIKEVVSSKNPPGSSVYEIPRICPVCGHEAIREEDTADIRCTNPFCKAKLIKRIINFVSRDAYDIKGFGDEYIKTLIDRKYISGIADIFRLKDHRDELISEGIIGKEKNTDKLLGMIDASRENPPERLLAGLSVENVGRTSARTIMRHFGSFEALMGASEEELRQIPDVGEKTAVSIYSFFHDPDIAGMMADLKALGLNMESPDNVSLGDAFAGRTYVITGDLESFANRGELVDYIEARGGKVAGSVSKKTYALINNDVGSNSGKNKKARELGIPVIPEADILKEGGS